jgi:hypothetical protein
LLPAAAPPQRRRQRRESAGGLRARHEPPFLLYAGRQLNSTLQDTGCKRPMEMGGAIFVVVALTPYGGWHKGAKECGQ